MENGDKIVDNVDNLKIEHNFCATCQVYHNSGFMVIRTREGREKGGKSPGES